MLPFKVLGYWVELTPLADGVGVKINCISKRIADKIYGYLQKEGFLDKGGILFY